jgi:hypothetical protein
VPREVVSQLERQLATIGDRIRDASDARWSRQGGETSLFAAKMRENIRRLEEKLQKARAAGREKDVARLETELANHRALLPGSDR